VQITRLNLAVKRLFEIFRKDVGGTMGLIATKFRHIFVIGQKKVLNK